jgi:hypothetical protein
VKPCCFSWLAYVVLLALKPDANTGLMLDKYQPVVVGAVEALMQAAIGSELAKVASAQVSRSSLMVVA